MSVTLTSVYDLMVSLLDSICTCHPAVGCLIFPYARPVLCHLQLITLCFVFQLKTCV